jgi:hypothetical protein
MTIEEMYCRVLCLEKSLKKANYRIYLLEKKRDVAQEAKRFFDLKEQEDDVVQLDLFEAVGV